MEETGSKNDPQERDRDSEERNVGETIARVPFRFRSPHNMRTIRRESVRKTGSKKVVQRLLWNE